MTIPKQTVLVKWNPSNKNHYVEKGYEFTGYNREFCVNVFDLTKAYSKEIVIICDYCLAEFQRNYRKVDFLKKHSCKKCNHGKKVKSVEKKLKKTSSNIITFCKFCNTEITKKNSEFKGHNQHFCSRSCMGKYKFKFNNPNPKKKKLKLLVINAENLQWNSHQLFKKINGISVVENVMRNIEVRI
ncbi:hypothetical protein LG296_20025 (plasmid) [Ureibacillus chungkukjangi]|uniref:hypothetical protein n=1 Tax=Ureibacillus chungkukjangi TaxID=1202712 RepID=UPI000D39986A|nr:hypothetical protein [Ureibacillus chungkukjangi]